MQLIYKKMHVLAMQNGEICCGLYRFYTVFRICYKPDADNAFDCRYFFGNFRSGDSFYIDNIIRKFGAVLIYHRKNIVVRFGQYGRDLPYHVRNVFVRDAKSGAAGGNVAFDFAFGKIDRIFNGAFFHKIAQFGNGHNGAVFFGFGSGCAQVRKTNNIFDAQKFFVGKIGYKAGNTAVFYGGAHIGVYHQAAARKIQYAYAPLYDF